MKRWIPRLRAPASSAAAHQDGHAAQDPTDDGSRRRIDELTAGLAALSDSVWSHGAWLADLQTWMTSCVQTLSALTDAPPTSSPVLQAAAPSARRIDEVEQLRRRLLIWTVMSWVEHADVPHNHLISVILPTHNRSRWLERAITSVRTQTYPDWELIVLDDDSDDGTDALVAGHVADDDRVRYLRVEFRNSPAARNVGLASAKGDLIAYLDDDNVMQRDWLKAVAWAFSSWPDTEALYGAQIIEDQLASGTVRSGEMPAIAFVPWDRRRLEQANYVDQGVIAHRAGLPEAHFDTALPMCQDWDLFLRLTTRRPPLELPALACLYGTTSPDRSSEAPDQHIGLRAVRARAHIGRPLRLLVALGPPHDQSEDIRSQAGALGGIGAEVHFALGDACDIDDAVSAHDPDLLLVFGLAATLADLPHLTAATRPFAVYALASDVGHTTRFQAHPLCLGVWGADHAPLDERFLKELSQALEAWKLTNS